MTGSTTARYCRCGTRLARDNSDNRCGPCQVADRMGEAGTARGRESGDGTIVARQRNSPSGATPLALVTGQDLRAARESAGIGLGQLAAKIGRSKGHLSKVETESEGRDVSPALVYDYERALGIAISSELEVSTEEHPTVLRVLLTERHLQVPKAFRAQFVRAAHELADRESDPEFRRQDVSDRQFQRWLDGQRPRPYACRVLEYMLDRPIGELLRPAVVLARTPTGLVRESPPTFGRLLNELREQRGLSFRRLGQLVHYSHGYLWDLETGSKRPTEEVASALDTALGANGELSALAAADLRLTTTPTQPTERVTTFEGSQHETTLPRGSTLDNDVDDGAEPWSVAEVIGRFSMPLSMVERMERLALAQVARYPHTAPPEMWPVVRRELARVRQALDRRQAVSVQLRLTKVAGILAGVAGNLSIDVGRRETALEYFDLSQLAGRESDDMDLTAWAISLESIDSFYNGHVGRATELLDQAAALSDRGSSARRRAWIAALRARAYAAKHDSVNACAALDRAMSLMRDADVPSGSDFFDQERLDGMAGTTFLFLGDTDRALELIRNALDRRSPADSKGRALLALDKAVCWARADQPESAYEAIHTALDLAQGQFVQPISTRAHEVVAEMSRWSTTAAGRVALERLKDLDGGS